MNARGRNVDAGSGSLVPCLVLRSGTVEAADIRRVGDIGQAALRRFISLRERILSNDENSADDQNADAYDSDCHQQAGAGAGPEAGRRGTRSDYGRILVRQNDAASTCHDRQEGFEFDQDGRDPGCGK